MKDRLLRRIAALDPRVVLLLIAALLFLAVFESWVVLRAPLAELRTLNAAEQRLATVLLREAGMAAQLQRLAADLAKSEQAAQGAPLRADDAMLPYLLTTLDGIAARHGVSLGGVKPPTQRPLGAFDEVSFQVEARGAYGALHDWLHEVLKQVAPLVATDLSLRSADEGQRVALAVKLSAYRPAAAVAAGTGAK